MFGLNGNRGKSNDETRDVIGGSCLFLLRCERFYSIDPNRWTLMKVLPQLSWAKATPEKRTGHSEDNVS